MTADPLGKKNSSAGVKFRKTKKMMGNSVSKYHFSNGNNNNNNYSHNNSFNKSTTAGRGNSSSKEDVMNATSLFTELKRKNLAFLS